MTAEKAYLMQTVHYVLAYTYTSDHMLCFACLYFSHCTEMTASRSSAVMREIENVSL